jgi:hypothetical protein
MRFARHPICRLICEQHAVSYVIAPAKSRVSVIVDIPSHGSNNGAYCQVAASASCGVRCKSAYVQNLRMRITKEESDFARRHHQRRAPWHRYCGFIRSS